MILTGIQCHAVHPTVFFEMVLSVLLSPPLSITEQFPHVIEMRKGGGVFFFFFFRHQT